MLTVFLFSAFSSNFPVFRCIHYPEEKRLERMIKYRESTENNSWFAVDIDNEACWFMCSVGLFEEFTSIGRPCSADRACINNAKWILYHTGGKITYPLGRPSLRLQPIISNSGGDALNENGGFGNISSRSPPKKTPSLEAFALFHFCRENRLGILFEGGVCYLETLGTALSRNLNSTLISSDCSPNGTAVLRDGTITGVHS